MNPHRPDPLPIPHPTYRTALRATCTLAGLMLAAAAHAQVITIDQAKALAGNVTPGDAPGFPVTLSVPGSYRLTGNLTVNDRQLNGLDVTAPGGVSIDLNGHTVRGARCGPQRCEVGLRPSFGIIRNASTGTLRVHDGRIENFGSTGLYVNPGNLQVERVVVVGHGEFGIVSNGPTQVFDSHVAENLSAGIRATAGILRGNIVRDNGSAQLGAPYGGNLLISGNLLLGPSPLGPAGHAAFISTGDNVCAPQGAHGERC